MLQRRFGATIAFTYNEESFSYFTDAEQAFLFICGIRKEMTTPDVDDMIDETGQQYLTRIRNIKDSMPSGETNWNQQ